MAEASTRDTRATQKQFRQAPAAQPAVRLPAQRMAEAKVKPVRPGQVAAARPATPAQHAIRHPAPQALASARGLVMPQARAATIQPQARAFDGLATPVIARGMMTAGTPILPVSVTSGISCVPFARLATGMNISGDARTWWYSAAGTYARGQQPERGSVLAFTASGGMSSGHVAVVSRVLNPRTVLIDHANWGGPGIRRGTVMRGVTVVDVSDRNDWTAVRVQVGHSAEAFGRTYSTHGFIYNRPAGSRMMTASIDGTMEVAEAPSPHAALHARFAAESLGR